MSRHCADRSSESLRLEDRRRVALEGLGLVWRGREPERNVLLVAVQLAG